jgi:hypothetical protein
VVLRYYANDHDGIYLHIVVSSCGVLLIDAFINKRSDIDSWPRMFVHECKATKGHATSPSSLPLSGESGLVFPVGGNSFDYSPLCRLGFSEKGAERSSVHLYRSRNF